MNHLIFFQIVILILSVIIHEVSHGYAALWMGDVTAKYAGRLTMNPIKHLDLFGSIILPAVLILSGTGFIVGWAKPVPYNPYNLRNQRWGELFVAIAGPLANILVAVFVAVFLRTLHFFDFNLTFHFINMAFIVIFINLFLAAFNLIPVPPLDGSKVLFNLFPGLALKIRPFMEMYQLVFLIIVLFFIVSSLAGIIFGFTNFLIGPVVLAI